MCLMFLLQLCMLWPRQAAFQFKCSIQHQNGESGLPALAILAEMSKEENKNPCSAAYAAPHLLHLGNFSVRVSHKW